MSGNFGKHNTGGVRRPLQSALLSLAGDRACITRHDERAWASVTFEGARHTFDLMFDGDTAVAAGEEFVAALPDHEFALPGYLVADAAVVAVEHTMVPNHHLTVTCEILLLRDG